METYEPNQSAIQFQPKNTARLWNDSEITKNYVAPELSFCKEERFKWASIYWPPQQQKTLNLNKKRQSEAD